MRNFCSGASFSTREKLTGAARFSRNPKEWKPFTIYLEIDVSNFVDITLGIVYLIMACVFDYGADVINVKVAQSKANLQSEAVVDVESEK